MSMDLNEMMHKDNPYFSYDPLMFNIHFREDKAVTLFGYSMEVTVHHEELHKQSLQRMLKVFQADLNETKTQKHFD